MIFRRPPPSHPLRVIPARCDRGQLPPDRSIAASINRAREVLGYAPRYSSLDALHEALAGLLPNGQADVGGQEF